MLNHYSFILGIYVGMLIVLIGSGIGTFLIYRKEVKEWKHIFQKKGD